ncbi:hypothetical protein EDB17_0457 [Vibrio crassostreae]|nr:hypothetical protein EDB66_0262 [Vibrio crassostreae]RPF05998.1 hypothetical protein EDB17_0457 [Vibrio crassostreae]
MELSYGGQYLKNGHLVTSNDESIKTNNFEWNGCGVIKW